MLNESGEIRNPCLVPMLEKKIQLLTFKYDVHFRFVIYDLYYVEVCSRCTHFVERFFFFFNKLKLNVVKKIFLHLFRLSNGF